MADRSVRRLRTSGLGLAEEPLPLARSSDRPRAEVSPAWNVVRRGTPALVRGGGTVFLATVGLVDGALLAVASEVDDVMLFVRGFGPTVDDALFSLASLGCEGGNRRKFNVVGTFGF